ncbi:MAG TPA: response regulator [Campylobacterales bacterium]|nr:response regulator [Campylobacterales bacterium]HIP45976.1 response regulator [Campylobacterales bacterium]
MKRVLVVDDEMMNRDLIRKVLTKEGLGVIEAINGKEALEILKRDKIDLVLMDLMMPVMDGFEAIGIIRKERCYDALPLIAVSALDDRQTYQRVLQLGADGCITKPFELSFLVACVKSALERER